MVDCRSRRGRCRPEVECRQLIANEPTSQRANDEAYFVRDGEVEFRVGGEVVHGTNGTFILVTAGAVHTFGNTSESSGRLLVLHAPALDQYFEELELPWARTDPPDRESEFDLMRRHGMEPT